MISVLCPSRGRPDALRESCDSLISRARYPATIEILVAIDADDTDSYTDGVALAGVTGVHVAAERHGYAGLSRYWDHLAAMAIGEWLLLWNDDARMLTPGWDQIIHLQSGAVLHGYTRDDRYDGDYFPAWPAAWARFLGYTSPIPGPHVDTYIHGLGKALGRVRRIPVEIEHHRPDYGHAEANDQTYQEGRGLLGPQGMVPGWDKETVGRVVTADAARIREAGL